VLLRCGVARARGVRFGRELRALSRSCADIALTSMTVLLGAGDICLSSTTPAQFATRFRAGMDALFATRSEFPSPRRGIWKSRSSPVTRARQHALYKRRRTASVHGPDCVLDETRPSSNVIRACPPLSASHR
jgi:hypothetical protein